MNVSIIIPAYNAADTIAETLESVLAQTYPHWEAIVVDDGSTDATAEIIADFVKRDPRIRVVRQPNGGEAAARNAGIPQARYGWLLFLDADDWIARFHLERMTGALLSDPQLDAVHCGSARVAPDGTLVVEKYSPPTGDLFPILARRAAFNVHACIVRKSLVEAVGGFDTSLQRLPDWDLWQRIARTGARFGAVREVLAFYRMRPDSASLDAYQVLRDGLRVLKHGHSPDARVSNPHPDHARGLPPEGVRTEEFYFLSWCAGLLLGNGKDARSLLELLKGEHYPELYPDAVAQCIFEAAPLPTCQPPRAWEQFWPSIQQHVDEFLVALEQQSMAPDLARRARAKLKKMILKQSPTWQPAIEEYEQTIEELEQSKGFLEKDRSNWQSLAEERDQTIRTQSGRIEELDQARAQLEVERGAWQQLAEERDQTIRTQSGRIEELFYSPERRFGDLLLNRMRLRGPVQAAARLSAAGFHRLTLAELAVEGRLLAGRNRRGRVLATVCWNFPIYSHTFVYQELTQLGRQGYDVRLIYSRLDPRKYLHSQFAHLWKAKRRLLLHRKIQEQDFARYHARMPEKVESLIRKLCDASGLARHELLRHDNFLQAFSFTRMAETFRAHYLHSYFFYDRSLMALVAGYLLNVPRGISCYADHLLKDYELKVVPLHMELCDVVVATSERIKRELLEIAPKADPDRIIVKPNAIVAERFPYLKRMEPTADGPFRLVCVSRIDPKKGLLYLVEAIHLLRQRGLRVELHLVGAADEGNESSQEYKRKLDQLISKLDLWGTVHLEGYQNEEGVLRFLRETHLFVAPFVETESGDKDGIPTSLLEAMATGLPAVATDAGSIKEVIDDGRDGVLVAQRGPAALADAIEALLREPDRRERLGREAADKVRRRFDVKACEEIFHERVGTLIDARRH